MNETVWTPERIEQLTKLWPDLSVSASEIGKRIGVPKNAVVGKAHRLGLTSRPACVKPSDHPHIRKKRADPSIEPRASVTCAWPYGDPGQEGFHFCGEETLIGRPYCADHCAVAYVPNKKRHSDAYADAFS